MNRYQIAFDTHAEGFNCCTAVVFAFQDKLGLTAEQCYAVTSGMGGGLRTGEVCGAVSGGVMVLGALAPHNKQTGPEGKEYNITLTQEFQRRFAEKQGYICCRDLKPIDAKYQVKKLEGEFNNCNHYILTAVEVLEEMIEEYKL